MSMSTIGDNFAKQTLWAIKQAERTDPEKFAHYMEWRKEELERRMLPRKKSFLSKIREMFSAKKNNDVMTCDCTFGVSPAAMSMGVGFHVCGKHASEYGIHGGLYSDDEIGLLILAAKEKKHQRQIVD